MRFELLGFVLSFASARPSEYDFAAQRVHRAHLSLARSSMNARCWAKVPSRTSTTRGVAVPLPQRRWAAISLMRGRALKGFTSTKPHEGANEALWRGVRKDVGSLALIGSAPTNA